MKLLCDTESCLHQSHKYVSEILPSDCCLCYPTAEGVLQPAVNPYLAPCLVFRVCSDTVEKQAFLTLDALKPRGIPRACPEKLYSRISLACLTGFRPGAVTYISECSISSHCIAISVIPKPYMTPRLITRVVVTS